MRRLVPYLVLLALTVPALTAWTWPVRGPVLQRFSFDRTHPYDAGQHRGIAIGADTGAAVVAPVGGTVTFAGTVPTSGKTLTIETADGLSVSLTHLGSLALARSAAVTEGDVVGTVGPSGVPELDVPYVHLGVRDVHDEQGYLDPLRFLPAPPQDDAAAPAAPPTATDPATAIEPSAAAPATPAAPSAAPVAAAAPSAAPVAAAPAAAPAAAAPTAAQLPARQAPSAVAASLRGSGGPGLDVASRTRAASPGRAASRAVVASRALIGGHAMRRTRDRALQLVASRPATHRPEPQRPETQRPETQQPETQRPATQRRVRSVQHAIERAPSPRPRVAAPGSVRARPGTARVHGSRFLFAVLLASLLVVAAIAAAAARMIKSPSSTPRGASTDPVAAEDPGRTGLALCQRAASYRPRRGLRGAGRRLRPLSPVEGQRRAHGERDGRARDAGDGVRRPERRVAA